MRVRDFIFEGAGDAAQREQARRLFEGIREFFRSPGRVLGNLKAFPGSDDELRVALPGKVITANDPELQQLLRGLVWVFVGHIQSDAPDRFQNAGGFNQRKGEVPPWIQVNSTIPVHVGDPKPTVKEWQYQVAFDGWSILSKNEDTIVHEIIHYLDSLRWKDPDGMRPTYNADDGRSTEHGAAQRYFSDPAEMNAYAQESLSKVEKQIRGARSYEDAVLRMGGSAAELYKKVYNQKLARFGDQVPEDVRRRLKKRAAQIWDDVLSQFST